MNGHDEALQAPSKGLSAMRATPDLTRTCPDCHENVTVVRHKGKMLFRGHVRDLPLPALLSVLHEQARTCDVVLTDGGAEGMLVVREGALVHAELAAQRGLSAFTEACTRTELVYAVSPAAPHDVTTIRASAEELVALGSRAADESQRVRALSEAEHSGRISRFQQDRERTSRALGHLALGVAVVLAAMVLLLRPVSHAADRTPAPIHAVR